MATAEVIYEDDKIVINITISPPVNNITVSPPVNNVTVEPPVNNVNFDQPVNINSIPNSTSNPRLPAMDNTHFISSGLFSGDFRP